MELKEHVQVGAHHPELDDPGPLLPRDGGKESAEKPCHAGGDERGTVAGGPDKVDVESVADGWLRRDPEIRWTRFERRCVSERRGPARFVFAAESRDSASLSLRAIDLQEMPSLE